MQELNTYVCGPQGAAVPLTREQKLERAVARVREIHRRSIFTATERFYCVHCRSREVEWPCPTVAALDALL